MPITRRQFLQTSATATAAATFLGPGAFTNPFLQRAIAQTIGDRYLLVVYLDGGNDGLNTVVPVDNGSIGNLRAAYEGARGISTGGIQLTAPQLAATVIGSDSATATPLALHPALQGLKNLFDLGKVAVIQGCGYPAANLSHLESRKKWERGDPLSGTFGDGWLGRYLAANYTTSDIPAAFVIDQKPRPIGEFRQYTTGAVETDLWSNLVFPSDAYDPSDHAIKQVAYLGLHALASGSAQTTYKFVGDVGLVTEAATQAYPPLHVDYLAGRAAWNAQYGFSTTTFKARLREIAKAIYGVVNGKVSARFFEIYQRGYDTHSAQGGVSGTHASLLAELGDGLELFYNDCASMGVEDKLCVLVWSEFGRRVQQNNDGTDHGTQAPMFVIGGNVTGGIYGHHPDINPAGLDANGNTAYSQAAANPHRSTDLRDVYGTLLQHWLGMSDPSTILPIDVGDPNLYWTAPNFDLGFV